MENSAQMIQELQNRCALQEQQIAELAAKVSWYKEQFRLRQRRRFGRLSEQSNQYQLQIFNEAETLVRHQEPEPKTERGNSNPKVGRWWLAQGFKAASEKTH